eukprot:jgi/Chlat1/3548/Chrsp231S03547
MAGQDKHYDVFLSHRGPDIKRGFGVWLKNELERQKLRVFFDDRSLQLGDHSPEMMDSAMQKATCGIVVLTPGFFASQWCMQELRTFLDRKNCLPVCFEVTPTDIDAEKIKNKKAGTVWEQHGGQLWTDCNMNEADWMQSVQDLASICMKSIKKYDGYEDTYARAIVQDVCKRLERPCTTGKRVNMMPFHDNKHFVGRSAELTQLENMLKNECGRVCIQGMGGAGKTQLVLKYVYSHRNQYDKLLWIDASKEALHSSFLGLAKPLGIETGVEKIKSWLPSILRPNQEKDRDIVAEIRTALEQSETPCLLVLDNVDDEEQYVKYLPKEGPCHVILTARQRMPGNLHVLELKDLEEAAACELLKSWLSPETPKERAKELAVALGCHALSLAVSARLMFKDNCEAEVVEVADLARKLLWLGGWFATVPIRSELLKHAAVNLSAMDYCNDDVETASGLLVEYALAERTRDGGTAFHPLVQSFGRWEGKKEGIQVAQAAIMAIAEVGEVGQDAEHVAYAVSMALPEVDDPSGVRVPLDDGDLLQVNDVALALAEFYVGLYQTAQASRMLDSCERVLQRVEPQDSSRWLRLWLLYCNCFRIEAKYVEAEALYKLALASSEARLGRNHVQTVLILNNLALVVQEQGKYGEAETLLRQALTATEMLVGPDHLSTATSCGNLAYVMGKQGKYGKAKAFHRRALSIYKAKLGPDHLDLASSLNNMAILLQKHGEYGEAEAMSREALAIRETKLGPDHPDTGSSLTMLAAVMQVQGEYSKAEDLNRRALGISEVKLGPHHPGTATALNNLALVLQEQGEHRKAEDLHRRAVAIREAKLGPEHPDTALAFSNLASVLHAQGEYSEAEALSRQALVIIKANMGPDHPDVAMILNNLAAFLQKQGKYDKAEALYRQALAICETQLGPHHPGTMTTLNNLGFALQQQGKYGDAEALLQTRALAMLQRQGNNNEDDGDGDGDDDDDDDNVDDEDGDDDEDEDEDAADHADPQRQTGR